MKLYDLDSAKGPDFVLTCTKSNDCQPIHFLHQVEAMIQKGMILLKYVIRQEKKMFPINDRHSIKFKENMF